MQPGSHPDRSSWRGAAARAPGPAAPAAGVPAWRSASAATAYRPRWGKVAAVAAALCACLVALSYAALWLRPPAPARLFVVEAAYDAALAVPPNAAGAAAGRDLLALAAGDGSRFGSRGRLRGAGAVRLTRGAGAGLWPELDRVEEQTVVLFVAAHGGRDADGAFLFPDDATPDPAHRVRLKAVLDRLAQLPAAKRKLLVLDATRPAAYPELGLFHNDFADALDRLEPDIAAVPNLAVLSSTGTDQRSWASPEWGRTAFAHFLIEGLKGPADADGNRRLTAWELFEYVRPRAHDWARDHRAALQTAQLLPRGEEGERRARDTFLTTVEREAAAPAPTAPAPFDPPPELERQWEEYRALAAAGPSPLTYAPHLWREYEAWVLRYEALLLDGAPEAAEGARTRAADARRRIEAARRLAVSPQTVALPFAVGGVGGPRDVPVAVADGIARLAEAAPADRAALWAAIRGTVPDRDPEAARLLWCAGAVKWAAVDPATRLAAAPSLVALVGEGMTVRPSELHLLSMFAAHVPPFAKADPVGPLLGRLLDLRATAEATAVSLPPAGEAHAGYCLPWCADAVAAGDAERRAAEDLAFAGSPAHWERAAARAAAVAPHYRTAAERAARVRLAVSAWHRAAAHLPAAAEWMTDLPSADHPARRKAREDALVEARDLWARVHALARVATGTVPPAPDDREKALRDLADAAGAVEARLTEIDARRTREAERLIASRPEFDARRETRAELVAWWQAAEALLSAPPARGSAPARRARLATEVRRVSRQLLVAGATRAEALPEVGPEAAREQALQAARWRGLLQLSRVGREGFPPAAAGAADAFDGLAFVLNNFALQAEGRAALAGVETALGRALGADPTPAAKPGAAPSVEELRRADRRVRLMPAAVAAAVGPGPADALRRLAAETVLLAQAERTYVDHWYGGAVPYYRSAVDHLLADARRIAGRDLGPAGQAWAKRLEKEPPFPLTPAAPQKLWLTDEPNLSVTYPLRRTPDDPAGPGFAVFWLDPPFPAALPPVGAVASAAPPRAVRATGLPVSAAPPEPVSAEVVPPAGPRPTAPVAVAGVARLNGFFRGRVAAAETAANFSPVPDRAAVKFPPPAAATLAVRADPALQAKYGAATGSVAFVLDCTGSMRPPPDAPPGNVGLYRPAVDVLARLLRDLPAGTHVAVWSFGQRTPDVKSAEDTIKEQMPLTRWNRDNRGAALDALLPTLRGLDPWDESSVMAAIHRARAGLRDAPGPFKAVVLVSDAVDNRFVRDPSLNPLRQTIKDALRTEFSDGAVRLGVVAFPVTDKADAASQEHFKAVETLRPAGKFVRAAQAGDMLGWLRSGLAPRIRYRVAPVAVEAAAPSAADLSAGDDGADNWYPGRLPPGQYELRVLADREYRQPLELRAGDRLLMRLTEDRGDLAARRVWYAAEAPAVARTPAEAAAGRLSLLQNQALDGNALRMMVAVEDRPPADAPLLAADRIGDAWFELTPTLPKPPAVAVRSAVEPGYPAPCWGLDVRGWPALPGGKGTAAPVLEAWWHPDGPFPSVLRWDLPAGERPLALPSTRLPVGDNAVSLDSVRLEEHRVSVGPGETAIKPCLAVRLSHAPGKPVWVRPIGVAPTGSEVRVYRGADKVTCLFWWADAPSAESLDRELRAFEVVSLADALREAAAAGRHLKLDGIPPPSPASVRPPPPAEVR